jgi:hypothetical protein
MHDIEFLSLVCIFIHFAIFCYFIVTNFNIVVIKYTNKLYDYIYYNNEIQSKKINAGHYKLIKSILVTKQYSNNEIICIPELILPNDFIIDPVKFLDNNLIINWSGLNTEKKDNFQYVLYIFYLYRLNEYIIPISKTNEYEIINLYQSSDLDSCRVFEYNNISTKFYSNNELDIIYKYAGPKANFYSDIIQIDINTKHLYFFILKYLNNNEDNTNTCTVLTDTSHTSFLSQHVIIHCDSVLQNTTDYLKLETFFGEKHKFKFGDNIIILSDL